MTDARYTCPDCGEPATKHHGCTPGDSVTVTVPRALLAAVREAEALREQPPERPLNEWRERREARIVAAKVALADYVMKAVGE